MSLYELTLGLLIANCLCFAIFLMLQVWSMGKEWLLLGLCILTVLSAVAIDMAT